MIDIYPQIYKGLKAELDKFSQSESVLLNKRKISFHNSFIRFSQAFPCVVIEEKANTNSEGEMDFVEKSSSLMYEVNVYDDGKKKNETCRAIAKAIDGYMAGRLGFSRINMESFPNLADSTIERYLLRYEGYIDNETGNISRTKY